MNKTLKILGLVALALLCAWVWCASGQPVPPAPPKPKAIVESPKGKEQRLSLAKVTITPLAIVPPAPQVLLATWDNQPWTNPPAGPLRTGLEGETNLLGPWRAITNLPFALHVSVIFTNRTPPFLFFRAFSGTNL